MFVVFEGIDGSGKTTISNRVVRRLAERGIDTCHLRQDGKFASSVTEAVRSLARDSRNLALVPEAELLLYAAREVQLTEEVLRPALAAGKVVVADRYLYTAEVLGRFGRGLDPEWVSSLLKLVARGLAPDLVVLVDVEPAVARARRKASKLQEPTNKPPSRKGLAGAGLAQRLRAGYLQLAAAEPERFAVVDNDAELETMVSRIQQLIEASLARGVARALVDFRADVAPAASVGSRVSPSDALERFLHKVGARAELEPGVAAFLLTGFFGAPVDALRRRLASSAARVVLHALTGLADVVSFELRQQLVKAYPAEVAASLLGIGNDVEGARELRLELLERAGADVAASLRGLLDNESFELREALYDRHPEAVLGSLAAQGGAWAWRLRERFLETRRSQLAEDAELAAVVMRGVRGLGDARSWELRDVCWPVAPVAVLKSLADLDDERSWRLREENLSRAPRPVLESLGQLRTDRAWQLREAAAESSKEAVDGIAGADDERAWALRERCAELWPSTVVKSIGALRDTARGRALLERQLARYGHELGVLRNASLLALDLPPGTAESEE
ncbi:MAG TPA: dTMP kinase [Polyangiaceae bacterium]|nr:dTMP kinase [Polyangiaceae bacterium]